MARPLVTKKRVGIGTSGSSPLRVLAGTEGATTSFA
jgi:hypothetical protein